MPPRCRDQLGRSTRSEGRQALCRRAGEDEDALFVLPAKKTKIRRKRAMGGRSAAGAEAEGEEEVEPKRSAELKEGKVK